jgi:spore maturation protein CgeB
MRILLVCMQHDYGDPARGYSYEYYNFAHSLVQAGHIVEWFDYMAELKKNGRQQMNADLISYAKKTKPDVAIFSLYTDQLDEVAVESVRSICKTFCFFHDDTWRVKFSRHWAQYFDFFSSSDFESLRKYPKLGLNNIVHIPFGVNNHLYKPLNEKEFLYDVSFVGGWNPVRGWLVKRLERAGIKVEAFGYGWPRGILAHEEMIKVFNNSRINLNLSNSTTWDARYLFSSPRAFATHFRSKKIVEQLKARHFEISACNAFQLSYYIEGLERCYKIGEEIAIYNSPDELVEKVEYYLDQPKLCEDIAHNAYARTLREHTYEERFSQLFTKMGFVWK